MQCESEMTKLIHSYLDGDLSKEDELTLRNHLEVCQKCQNHFHELSRTITLIKSTEQIESPRNFPEKIMEKLPTEKWYFKYMRFFRRHPLLTAITVLFLLFTTTILSVWNEDSELVVSKQKDLVIEGDTVIVPHEVTIEGDLFVKNGDLKINGSVEGDVTLINGKLILQDDNAIEDERLVASVTGELNHIEQLVEWLWYHIKNFFESLLALGTIMQ